MSVVTPLTRSDGPMTARGAFLFSDIVNSTAIAEAVGDDRWAEILRAHNRMIRGAVDIHGGEECAFLGDGFLVLFADPYDAFACAVAIQQAFSAFPATFPDAPVRVRIGVHCGTAWREGRDVYGRAVHFASRIASQARGGEILLSACAADQLRPLLPHRFDAREVTLKGLDGTHRLISVWPAASAALPRTPVLPATDAPAPDNTPPLSPPRTANRRRHPRLRDPAWLGSAAPRGRRNRMSWPRTAMSSGA